MVANELGGGLLFSGCGGRLLSGKLQLLKLPSFFS